MNDKMKELERSHNFWMGVASTGFTICMVGLLILLYVG